MGTRLIKKYPNRRLYDTNTSTYITLTDIKQLVMEREEFVVRDAKTNEDITRSILLQIILDEEAGGSPMFTTPVLANVIRFYGNAMQGLMGNYLEKNMQTLMDMQAKLGEQAGGITPDLWSQYMNMQAPMLQGLMGNNAFQQMQEQMQKQTEQFLGSFGMKRST